jgi:hypothetical protein
MNLRIAWILTAVVAFALGLMTALLAIRTLEAAQMGSQAYVTGSNLRIYLRDEPEGSGQVLSVLSRNQEVRLLETEEHDGRLWARIRVGAKTGWLLTSYLSSNPPGE